jgi:hypothetical protein
MTEYIFEVKGEIKITLDGGDTEQNYELAQMNAINQIKANADSYVSDVLVTTDVKQLEPEEL